MTFTGFTKSDFETFSIEGLEPRMQAIRTRIQPKFKALGTELTGDVSLLTGQEMFLHIAQHARRKTNAPNDTWLAICHNKRGYKQHPHFQVGLFGDRVFIWFALIYEAPNKQSFAQAMLHRLNEVTRGIPADFVVSLDHMKKDAESVGSMSEHDWQQTLERLRDVKKAELLIGRHVMAGDPILADGKRFIQLARDTFASSMPLYRLAQA